MARRDREGDGATAAKRPLPAEPPVDLRERTRVVGEVAARLFDDPSARLRLGRFEIRGRLGAGGAGLVYDGFDPLLGRAVALKVLRARKAGRDRLLREARALARLSHPHVVGVHEVGQTDDGEVFVALERVAGETLQAHLRRRRPGPRGILAMFRDAGEGLAAVHAAGLVHGDFKPENVLVDAGSGRVRLGDFGLARRATDDGSTRSGPGPVAGTPPYMAPELHRGDSPTPASDQLAYAASLVEALTGVVPAAGARVPPIPGLGASVSRALTRALAARPEERFADLPALLDGLAPAHPSRWRRRLAVGVAGALALWVLLGMAFQVRMFLDHRRAIDQATGAGAPEVGGGALPQEPPGPRR